MINNTPIMLSDKLFSQVEHIGEILGLTPAECAEYLIELCLQGYDNGLTLRLCDFGEMLGYKTWEKPRQRLDDWKRKLSRIT